MIKLAISTSMMDKVGFSGCTVATFVKKRRLSSEGLESFLKNNGLKKNSDRFQIIFDGLRTVVGGARVVSGAGKKSI